MNWQPDDYGVPQAFDALLEELSDTVIPNLERFPAMGRLFFERPIRSVEASNAIDHLKQKLKALASEGEMREYVISHHLLLYARLDTSIYLLSIRHTTGSFHLTLSRTGGVR